MKLDLNTLLLLAATTSLLPSTALAAIGGKCTHLVGGALTDDDYGICISRKDCKRWGGRSDFAGYCPYDGNSIRCCILTECDGESSTCAWTDRGQCRTDEGDHFVSNKCPGGSNYKCCKRS